MDDHDRQKHKHQHQTIDPKQLKGISQDVKATLAHSEVDAKELHTIGDDPELSKTASMAYILIFCCVFPVSLGVFVTAGYFVGKSLGDGLEVWLAIAGVVLSLVVCFCALQCEMRCTHLNRDIEEFAEEGKEEKMAHDYDSHEKGTHHKDKNHILLDQFYDCFNHIEAGLSDGRHRILAYQLHPVCAAFDPFYEDQDVDYLMKMMDDDKDGEISPEEFAAYLKVHMKGWESYKIEEVIMQIKNPKPEVLEREHLHRAAEHDRRKCHHSDDPDAEQYGGSLGC